MYGADLSLFQFHGQLTWAVFFLNADRAIYGRYGSRGARRGRKDNDKDISLEGFKKAAEGALELHKAYPANKAALAGKTGPAPGARTPEQYPVAAIHNFQPVEKTQGKNCIHCHQSQDFELMSARRAGQPIADRLVWTYPMPDLLGLAFDGKERATVSAASPGSAAEKAGFKAGDKILTMEGQPLLSIADVQWVLHQAKEPGSVKAEVERAGKKIDLTLVIEEGWRRKVSFADTLSLGWVTRQQVAGMACVALAPAEKEKIGLASDALALKITNVTPDFVKDRNPSARKIGLQKDDILVEVDGRRASITESDFLSYLLQKKGKGDKVELVYKRGEKIEKVQLDLP
jgi:predicted metalloprotease with PDZ domain